MQDRRLTSFAALYLAAEAVGAALWWVVLLMHPASRAPFVAPGAPDSTLLALFLSDACLFIGGSALAAWALLRGKPWAGAALWLHLGAAAYAALYAIGLLLWTGKGWLGALLMLPSLTVTPYLAWRLARP